MRGSQFAELCAFVAVAEHRNFTKAAAQLGVSRPSLSKTIRSLEDRLGVRLLNRTTRSVALTEAGERLLADAQPVLDGTNRAFEAVNAFRDKPTGTLRLSMTRAVASLLVGSLLPQFLAQFPDIKLEVSADDTHSDIVSSRFDAGIRIGERIAKDMIAVVCSKSSTGWPSPRQPIWRITQPLRHRRISMRTIVCDCVRIGTPRSSHGFSRMPTDGSR